MESEKISFELDNNAINIVLRSISYLNDNYYHTHIVDKQRLVTDKVDVERVITILKSASAKKQDIVTIQMTRNDWYSYQNLISYTPYVLPSDRVDDAEFLEDLDWLYMDEEDD